MASVGPTMMPRSWLTPATEVQRSAFPVSVTRQLSVRFTVIASVEPSMALQPVPSLLGSTYWPVLTASTTWLEGRNWRVRVVGEYAVPGPAPANTALAANTVFAGAGPGTAYSPTTLTLQFLPSSQVVDAVSTGQYVLPSNDGTGWSAIDGSTLAITVNRTDNCLVTLTGNADLW